jgi:ribosome biogenesis GTPase
MEKEELKNYFPEFEQYEDECKFLGCVHVNEPVCGVKEALKCGKISKSRYENYKLLYEELKENEKRKYS